MTTLFENLPKNKKLYFASDFHLGVPDHEHSLRREKLIVSWLEEIRSDAGGIFLVGDIFDFWFEYRQTIPKGFTRFLGKIAELSDGGIPILFFTGNHDMWMFDYLPQELNVQIFNKEEAFVIHDQKLLIGHGDGLGPGDGMYKLYKRIFNNRFCQTLFEWLHPNIGIGIAKYWSRKSRAQSDPEILDSEAEWLIQYCQEVEEENHHDFYIFGHRHVATYTSINDTSIYINLGDWFEKCTYAEYQDGKMRLQSFPH